MNTAQTTLPRDRQSGFVLATCLVFLVVLSITAFLAARLTRSDVQVVNNLQNEKEALTIAEAGVHEALYRLSLVNLDTATVPTIGTFNAAIKPQDGLNSTWNAKILFNTSLPSLAGTAPSQTLSTPSLQLVNQRLPYSNNGSGNASNPVSETLAIAWDKCVSATGPGCSGFTTDDRRKLPETLAVSRRRPVVRITSTGQSGSARRTVIVKAIDCVPDQAGGPGSLTTLNTGCGNGNSVSLNGGNTITAAGTVQINAGATSNPPSSCVGALTVGGASITSTGGDVNVVGGVSGTYTPSPTTGVTAALDPYGNLAPPTFGAGGLVTDVRSGSPGTPSTFVVNTAGATISPGIYYGGIDIRANDVHMATGIYVIAGGGFTVGNNASVSSNTGGVMIYNTQVAGIPAQSFSLNNGSTAPSFSALTSGPFQGVVFYQDRSIPPTQPEIFVQGGGVTRIMDGLIYAPNAVFHTQGNNQVTIGGSMVVATVDMGGQSDLAIQNPTTPGPNDECGGLAFRPIGWQDF